MAPGSLGSAVKDFLIKEEVTPLTPEIQSLMTDWVTEVPLLYVSILPIRP